MARRDVLARLLHEIRAVKPGQRALVAIDGVDGAGKTELARELTTLAQGGRSLASVSIDGFHNPRAVRYAGGKTPETFFRASYDYALFVECVLEPFARGEAIVPAAWDVFTDAPVSAPPLALADDCVLLVEGIFMHRPELRSFWDASVWIEVPFAVSVPGGNARFGDDFDADPEGASNARYVLGQQLYMSECAPSTHATWVLDNTDIDAPKLSRR
jgi:uridine kinase